MAIKIFLVLFIFLNFNIQADDDYIPGYFLEIIEDEPKFFQRIVWEKDENALYYEVNILIRDNLGYSDYLTETTDNFFLNVSLPAGDYRYSITGYDLLERRGSTSEWIDFTVIKAYQPQIDRIVPVVFFLDQRVPRVLHIAGSNIFYESEIFLRSVSNIIHYPIETIISENRTSLVFDDRSLSVGIYNLHIMNPGGLEVIRPEFRIAYRKPLDIFFKTAWLPIVPIYGSLRELINPNFFFSGFGIGMEAVSSARSTFNGGFEVSLTVLLLNQLTAYNGNIYNIVRSMQSSDAGAFITKVDFNVVLQKRYYNNMFAVTVRFGAGMGPYIGIGSGSENGVAITFNAAASNQFLLFDIFHLEVGVDYSHYISDIPSGTICPRLGFTWKF